MGMSQQDAQEFFKIVDNYIAAKKGRSLVVATSRPDEQFLSNFEKIFNLDAG